MITLRKILTLGILGVIVIPGFSYAQSNDLMNRLNRLENEIETLNRAVYRGEKPPPSERNFQAFDQNVSSANAEIRLQELELQLRELTGKIEQQSFDVRQLQNRLDNVVADVEKRVGAVENRQPDHSDIFVRQNQPTISSQPTIETPEPNFVQSTQPSAGTVQTLELPKPQGMQSISMPTGSAASVYEQAFSLIKSGNYDEAEKQFDAFVKDYPDHALTPNAQYWLGETFYVRNDYKKAAQIFAKSYQDYPQGPKAADNLLKLGLSLAGTGKKSDACIALKQIPVKHANGPGPVLQRAEQEMSDLGCL